MKKQQKCPPRAALPLTALAIPQEGKGCVPRALQPKRPSGWTSGLQARGLLRLRGAPFTVPPQAQESWLPSLDIAFLMSKTHPALKDSDHPQLSWQEDGCMSAIFVPAPGNRLRTFLQRTWNFVQTSGLCFAFNS